MNIRNITIVLQRPKLLLCNRIKQLLGNFFKELEELINKYIAVIDIKYNTRTVIYIHCIYVKEMNYDCLKKNFFLRYSISQQHAVETFVYPGHRCHSNIRGIFDISRRRQKIWRTNDPSWTFL